MSSIGPAKTYEYEFSREMPAGLGAAWAAWTDPERYGEWFGAIPGWSSSASARGAVGRCHFPRETGESQKP